MKVGNFSFVSSTYYFPKQSLKSPAIFWKSIPTNSKDNACGKVGSKTPLLVSHLQWQDVSQIWHVLCTLYQEVHGKKINNWNKFGNDCVVGLVDESPNRWKRFHVQPLKKSFKCCWIAPHCSWLAFKLDALDVCWKLSACKSTQKKIWHYNL